MSELNPSDEHPWIDLGHGVRVRFRDLDGEKTGLEYEHPCKTEGPSWIPFAGRACETVPDACWTVESEQPLTLSPSLLCRTCGHHGFIRDGKWVPT